MVASIFCSIIPIYPLYNLYNPCKGTPSVILQTLLIEPRNAWHHDTEFHVKRRHVNAPALHGARRQTQEIPVAASAHLLPHNVVSVYVYIMYYTYCICESWMEPPERQAIEWSFVSSWKDDLFAFIIKMPTMHRHLLSSGTGAMDISGISAFLHVDCWSTCHEKNSCQQCTMPMAIETSSMLLPTFHT